MKKILSITVLGLAMIFGSTTMAFATSASSLATPFNAIVDNQADNGIGNSNQTGLNVDLQQQADSVIKSTDMTLKFDVNGVKVPGDVTQRTHGEYQNNTNSCASCHQTHTGAADNLLFKSSIFDTCTACHDGTLGFYNVFAPSTAGTFVGTPEGNASFHMANGSLEVKAAPGGNQSLTGSGKDGLGEHTWTGEFTCASCHSPHGSYSSRLLNYNPNGIASVPMVDEDGSYTGTTGASTGGQMVRDVVVNALPVASADSAAYVLLQAQADTVLDASILNNSTYSTTSGSTVVVVMKRGSSSPYTYVRDTTPWLFGGEYKDDHSFKVNFTKFYAATTDMAWLQMDDATATANGDPQITKTGLSYYYQKGFATLTGTLKDNRKPAATSYGTSAVGLKADISRAFVVNLTMDPWNYEYFGAVGTGVKITQVSPANYSDAGKGVAISTFCAACHTDYLGSSSNSVADGGTGGSGVWTKAFRHSTNSDTYTCLKCHFAHGTDVTVMMDAQDRGIATAATDLFAGDTTAATAYLTDRNASSALKRYTNMSVCWKCHTSSHSVGLMNNDYVNNVKFDADGSNNLTNGFVATSNSALPYFKTTANVVLP